MVMAQAWPKTTHREAIKILKRAQNVITQYSAPEFAQQPLLKSSPEALPPRDEFLD
jgi:hypothetical protein